MNGQCLQSRSEDHEVLLRNAIAEILGTGSGIDRRTDIETDHETGDATGLERGEKTVRERGSAIAQETDGEIAPKRRPAAKNVRAREIAGARKHRGNDNAHDRLYPTAPASSALALHLLPRLLHPNAVERLDRPLPTSVLKRLFHRKRSHFAVSTTLSRRQASMEGHRPTKKSPTSRLRVRSRKPQIVSREPRSR